jgi:hypothetical protein
VPIRGPCRSGIFGLVERDGSEPRRGALEKATPPARWSPSLAIAELRNARLASRLAHAIATIVAVFDPELVVRGGGLAYGADLALKALATVLRSLTPLRAKVRRGELGDNAVLFGAITTTTGVDVARDVVHQQRPPTRGAAQLLESDRRIGHPISVSHSSTLLVSSSPTR